MNKMLNAALWYQKNGYSVIPAKKNKKPFVKWQQFQQAPAGEVQIREWWDKWPTANIALLTGMKSNLTVIDIDSEAGRDAISEFLPETATFPTVKTPKGWHYYFNFNPQVKNGVRVLNDCDTRSEGGYVIAPPSSNGDKKTYVWVDGLKISDTKKIQIPEFLALTLEQGSFNAKSNKIDIDPLVNARARVSLYNNKPDLTTITNHNNHNNLTPEVIPLHRRDDMFFHLANHLVKSNMPKDNIRFFLRLFLNNCTEQNPDDLYTEKDVDTKIESAFKRSFDREKVSMHEVREWVRITNGNFSITNAIQDLTIITKEAKQKLRVYLNRLVNDEGMIERVGNRDGVFRRIQTELNVIDIYNVETTYLDVKYPLEIHEFFATMPKNIIVIAGTPNVGKTAFLLNVAAKNMNRKSLNMPIRYFTSEMGGSELASRLKMFEPEIPYSFWKNVKFCDHSSGFADRIEPDGLNIIDYLEIPTEFWQVGERLKEIYDKLNTGIAVVALQKKFGQKLGRGAEFSLEKPRLYVSLEANPPEGNIAEIIKCKNFARKDVNPNHMKCVFNVIQGVEVRKQCRWTHPKMKEVKE